MVETMKCITMLSKIVTLPKRTKDQYSNEDVLVVIGIIHAQVERLGELCVQSRGSTSNGITLSWLIKDT